MVSEPETHTILLFDVLDPTVLPRFLSATGGLGDAPGLFRMPGGIAIDAARHRIYASDTYNHRLQVLSYERAADRSALTITDFLTLGQEGSGVDDFNEPGGLTLNSDGELYALDVMNSRVKVYSPSGDVLRTFGQNGVGPGEFIAPMALDFSPDGKTLYIVDSYNYRIQALDPEGRFLFQFGGPRRTNKPKTVGAGEFVWPFGIAVSKRDGAVFVTDAAGQMVQKFDANGKFLLEWGHLGTEPGEFYKPKGIAYDEINDRLFVIDFGNHRGQIFTPEGAFIEMFGIGSVYTEPVARARDVERSITRTR